MAKKWYPVIDYGSCIECGTCVDNCPHNVYDTAKSPVPVVKTPESCVDHCHGCGNRCPVGAITYVGDGTGWTPPNGNSRESEPCCPGAAAGQEILIEYMYLDLQICERCQGTEGVLDEVVSVLDPALQMAGYSVRYVKTEIATAELAEKHRFLSSPTVRVNGVDICRSIQENECGCCSEISGNEVACRVFEYRGQLYEVPPKEMLAAAILQNLSVPQEACSCTGYQLPDNLKAFFAGKKNKPSCCSGGQCC